MSAAGSAPGGGGGNVFGQPNLLPSFGSTEHLGQLGALAAQQQQQLQQHSAPMSGRDASGELSEDLLFRSPLQPSSFVHQTSTPASARCAHSEGLGWWWAAGAVTSSVRLVPCRLSLAGCDWQHEC